MKKLLFLCLLIWSCGGPGKETKQVSPGMLSGIPALTLPLSIDNVRFFDHFKKYAPLDSLTARSLGLFNGNALQPVHTAIGKVTVSGYTYLLYNINDVDYDEIRMAAFDENEKKISDQGLIDFFNKSQLEKVSWQLSVNSGLRITAALSIRYFANEEMTISTGQTVIVEEWSASKGIFKRLSHNESNQRSTEEEEGVFYEEYQWTCTKTNEEITLTVTGPEKQAEYFISKNGADAKPMVELREKNNGSNYVFRIGDGEQVFDFSDLRTRGDKQIPVATTITRKSSNDIFVLRE